jgi:phage repressor protein C with HTH and peptisase S24 domain
LEIRSNEIDRVSRPQSLAKDSDAYAITMVGDSMWPRFRPGRRLAVSPRSPVAIGDDVLVRLHEKRAGGDLVLLKELVRRAATFLELRQFNPETSFRIETSEIESIEKVLGEVI